MSRDRLSLQANRWYHMAFTYNMSTTTQTVYINGVAGRAKRQQSRRIAWILCFLCRDIVDAVNPSSSPCHNYSWLAVDRIIPTGWWWLLQRLHRSAPDSFQSVLNQLLEILDDATLVARYPMDCITYPGWDSGPNQITASAVSVTLSGDGGRLGQGFLFNNPSAYFNPQTLYC